MTDDSIRVDKVTVGNLADDSRQTCCPIKPVSFHFLFDHSVNISSRNKAFQHPSVAFILHNFIRLQVLIDTVDQKNFIVKPLGEVGRL